METIDLGQLKHAIGDSASPTSRGAAPCKRAEISATGGSKMLGAGGMGEVYLGEDTRLGRKVAIKVLPAELLPVNDHD